MTEHISDAAVRGVVVIERRSDYERAVSGAAAYTGFSASTVVRAVASGELAAHQPGGKGHALLFSRRELDRWVTSRKAA